MLFYLRAGWIRWTIGTVLLAIALVFVYDLRGVRTPLYVLPTRIGVDPATLFAWIAIGILADLMVPLLALAAGLLVFPKSLVRWTTKAPLRLYGKASLPLAIACGLSVALIEEPLLRMHLQPELMDQMGVEGGMALLAAVVFALYWTPLTNLLGLWSIVRFLILTYCLEKGGSNLVPMVVHGFGDFFWIALWGQLAKLGMTNERTVAQPFRDARAA